MRHLTDQINTRLMSLEKEQFILGRDQEVIDIIKHFDRVLDGEFATCVISGKAGVGKTYLVSFVAQKLINVNATYIYGKFKHYNNQMFSAIAEVLIQMVEQSLTFSEQRLDAVKKLLRAELGKASNLITEICPDAEKLVGYYRKMNEEDYHKLEHRFQRAIHTFLDILSQELYPLIIHIDDLQWADDGSLRMIESLCRKPKNMNFYMMLSLRDEEQTNQVKMKELKVLLEHEKNNLTIKLRRLNLEETEEFLNCLFDNQVYEGKKVAEHLFKATLGTPFYIKQLIETIITQKEIYYQSKINLWIFDISFLEKLQLPEDIQCILISHINQLSEYDQELLELLACLGGQADKKLLGKIIITESQKSFERLEKLCKTGLLIKVANEKDECYTKYLFSHDIIFDIIHSAMGEAKREKNHYIIANKLIDDSDKIYTDDHRIFIALQLLECEELIQKEIDSSKYVLELYYAGLKAKQTTLIEQALRFFELCIVLMPSSSDVISFDLLMLVRLELAECQFICGFREEAEYGFEKLIKDYINKQDLVSIKSRLILLYTYSGNYKKVLALCLEVLEHLDFKIGTDHIRLNLGKEIIKSKRLFTNEKIDKLTYAPKIDDLRLLHIENTLIRMAAIANLMDEELFALLIVKLSNLSVMYGNSDFSAPAYVAYGFILCHLFGDDKKAFKLSGIAETLLENTDDVTIKCMTYFIMGTFIEHWKSSAEKSIKYLMKSIEIGAAGGEFQYAGYAFTAMVEMRYTMGTSLDDLPQYFDLLSQYDERLKHDITKSTLSILKSHLDQLRGTGLTELQEKSILHLDNSQILTYYHFKLQRLYLEEKIEECYHLLGKIVPMSGMFKGYILQADCFLFTTLVRLDIHRSLKGIKKFYNKRSIRQALKQFEKWIKVSKYNHFARYIYIKAKYAEVFYKSEDVGALYEEGITHAKEHKQVQLEALGNLLAGKHYENNKRVATVYRKEAIIKLEKWGANHYAKQLRERYELEPQEDNTNKLKNETARITKHLNQEKSNYNTTNKMSYHIKQVENMDRDQTFLYILKDLVLGSKIDYGAIYLEHNDQVHMAYEWVEGNTIKHHELIHMEKVHSIPHKVMRYVVRTGNEIRLAKKPSSGIFVNDSYFKNKENISLICVPLKYMEVFSGIIYLEWHKTNGYDDFVIEMIKSYMPLLITKTISKPKNKQGVTNNEIPLTRRETEVFRLIIKGLTNKQIGEQLSISLSTVKTHVINIYSKFNIKNRVAAVEKARELGFVD